MKLKRTLAIGLVAVLGIAACSNNVASQPSASTAQSAAPSAAAPSTPAEARTLTVWLMNGSASDDLVKQLNDEFTAAHPGVTVKYEVQQWNGIVSRLNGALAAPQPPVIAGGQLTGAIRGSAERAKEVVARDSLT